MPHRWLFTLLYGLHVVWTGLQRNIEAQAYKPNALWFCLVMGLAAIMASFMFRAGRNRAAKLLMSVVLAIVFGFYLFSFIKDPAEDATVRVGLILLTSIAEAAVVFMPAGRVERR